MSTHTAPVFTELEGWGMIVCEPCGYVVWPKHIAVHCKKRHGMDPVVAAATAAGYENDYLKQGLAELELPTYIETPFPSLPVVHGLVCQVNPDVCRYACI